MFKNTVPHNKAQCRRLIELYEDLQSPREVIYELVQYLDTDTLCDFVTYYSETHGIRIDDVTDFDVEYTILG